MTVVEVQNSASRVGGDFLEWEYWVLRWSWDGAVSIYSVITFVTY